MDPAHKKILVSNRVMFVRDLTAVDDVLDELQTDNTITVEQACHIQVECTGSDKIRKLLDIIVQRGPNAFHRFYFALKQSGNNHLADVLKPGLKYEKVQNQHSVDEVDEIPEEFSEKLDVKVRLCNPNHVENSYLHNLCYPMMADPRGRVIIINNEIFYTDDLSDRTGTQFDVDALTELFTQLSFEVTTKNNATIQDMHKILSEEASSEKNAASNCFVLVILSHGCKEGIYGVSSGEQVITVNEIKRYFIAEKCPALEGKPKLLILQACQGVNYDEQKENDNLETPLETEALVTWEHYFVLQSTFPGFVSWRNIKLGTWMIRSLVHVFQHLAYKYDLEMLCQKVNHLVSQKRAEMKFRQVCVFETQLMKKLYFFPGLPPKENRLGEKERL